MKNTSSKYCTRRTKHFARKWKEMMRKLSIKFAKSLVKQWYPREEIQAAYKVHGKKIVHDVVFQMYRNNAKPRMNKRDWIEFRKKVPLRIRKKTVHEIHDKEVKR